MPLVSLCAISKWIVPECSYAESELKSKCRQELFRYYFMSFHFLCMWLFQWTTFRILLRLNWDSHPMAIYICWRLHQVKYEIESCTDLYQLHKTSLISLYESYCLYSIQCIQILEFPSDYIMIVFMYCISLLIWYDGLMRSPNTLWICSLVSFADLGSYCLSHFCHSHYFFYLIFVFNVSLLFINVGRHISSILVH